MQSESPSMSCRHRDTAMKTSCLFSLLSAALLPMAAQAAPTINSIIVSGLFEPYGIAVDADNQYFITDNSNRILKYSPDNGQLLTVAGVEKEYGTNDGPGILARFFAPRGIVAYRGGMAVADAGNHTIRFIDYTNRSLAMVTTLAGRPGQGGAAADGAALSVTFNSPSALASDGTRLFIADTKNNVIRVLETNTVRTIAEGLNEPAGLAMGTAGEIYVSNTRNHTVQLLTPQGDGTYAMSILAGSDSGVYGTNDSLFAQSARFNQPGGLAWVSDTVGLVVADTGNDTLRRVFIQSDLTAYFGTNVWTVETYAGVPQTPGNVDGYLEQARLNMPQSFCKDKEGGLLVVDSGNSSLRRIQILPALEPVTTPKIGYVTWVTNEFGIEISKLVPFSNATFYNDELIAILGEPNTITYTKGKTPGLFDADTIPVPAAGVSGEAAPPYYDGLTRDKVPLTIIDPNVSSAEDLTIKAVGSEDGRRPSSIVQARVQFKTSPPIIIGDNPASFTLQCDTTGAEMWYTIDTLPSGEDVPMTNNYGPYLTGSKVSINITETVVLKAQAFRKNYQPSEIVTKTFSPTEFAANRITFGFEKRVGSIGGPEASSDFVGAAGQWFYMPITLSTLSGSKFYSLQFNVTATNVAGAPAIASGAFQFESMLLKPIPGTQPVVYEEIPPSMFVAYTRDSNDEWVDVFTNLVFTNASVNLLGVGWLERSGKTNLFDTSKQDLVTYSMAHDKMYFSQNGKIILGAYCFRIPNNSIAGNKYRIQIGRPSATSDGVAEDVLIDAPTNGSLSAGAVNALKEVTVAYPGYIVGDVSPFRWFNAGDFGDGYLKNNDVLQTFQTMMFLLPSGGNWYMAGHALNRPPVDSDLYDAMDSSNGTGNALDGGDSQINNNLFGDGTIDVTDVYVTFRRALDPSLNWVFRYWTNGVRAVTTTNNVFPQGAAVPAQRITMSSPTLPAEAATISQSTETPSARFVADDFVAEPGQTIAVPVRAYVRGKYPLRTVLMSVTVRALDGSPAIEEAIQFVPSAMLGEPTMKVSNNNAHLGLTWLDTTVAGVWGTNLVGTLLVTIPSSATEKAAYKVELTHLSASPNGLGVIPSQRQDGLVTLGDRSASSMHDSIPDAWRLRYFGTARNILSAADADADGDGMSNAAEYKAGTNPVDTQSALRLLSTERQKSGPRAIKLRWPTAEKKVYVLEVSPSLTEPQWTVLATDIPGTGWTTEYTDAVQGDAPRFYRVRLTEGQ